MKETFYEKCDCILRYLDSKPSPFIESLSLEKFFKETKLDKNDNVVAFLKEKKYIDTTSSSININSLGHAFISHNSFCQIELNKETEQSLKWYETQNATVQFI